MFRENVPSLGLSGKTNNNVHGHVKVELQEHGKTVRTVEHDNYVDERWFKAYAKILNHCVPSISYSGGSEATSRTILRTGTFGVSLMHGLSLTDYAGAAGSENQIPKGNFLASSYYGYSGTGAATGSFNPSESYARANSLRFVYDFTTTQANGTFQSVYTYPTVAYPTANMNLRCYAEGMNIISYLGNTFGYFDCCYANGSMYALYSDSVRRVSMDNLLTSYAGMTFSWDENVPVSNIKYNTLITSDGNYVYWMGSSNKLMRAPVNDLASYSVVNTMPSGFNTVYMPSRNSFFQILSSSSSNSVLCEYDNSFNEIHRYSYAGSLDDRKMITFKTDTHAIGLVSKSAMRLFGFDENTSALTPSLTSSGSNTDYSSSYYPIDANLYLGKQVDNYNYPCIRPQTFYFSHARLDEPVTKNNRQTMKITYDFNIDPINWDA